MKSRKHFQISRQIFILQIFAKSPSRHGEEFALEVSTNTRRWIFLRRWRFFFCGTHFFNIFWLVDLLLKKILKFIKIKVKNSSPVNTPRRLILCRQRKNSSLSIRRVFVGIFFAMSRWALSKNLQNGNLAGNLKVFLSKFFAMCRWAQSIEDSTSVYFLFLEWKLSFLWFGHASLVTFTSCTCQTDYCRPFLKMLLRTEKSGKRWRDKKHWNFSLWVWTLKKGLLLCCG